MKRIHKLNKDFVIYNALRCYHYQLLDNLYTEHKAHNTVEISEINHTQRILYKLIKKYEKKIKRHTR